MDVLLKLLRVVSDNVTGTMLVEREMYSERIRSIDFYFKSVPNLHPPTVPLLSISILPEMGVQEGHCNSTNPRRTEVLVCLILWRQ